MWTGVHSTVPILLSLRKKSEGIVIRLDKQLKHHEKAERQMTKSTLNIHLSLDDWELFFWSSFFSTCCTEKFFLVLHVFLMTQQ